MCWIYSVICWSNTKRFFSILIVFGKCFYFEKCQNFQNLCNSIPVTHSRRSLQSRDPSRKLTQKLSRLSGESSPLLQKRLRKISKFLGFSIFCDLVWRLVCKWKLQLQVYLECFDSLCDLLATGPSNHEKHLNKFFKICGMGFWRLDLVTCSRLILVAKNACFAQIGLYSRQFSKTIQFPLHHVLVHCLVCLSLFQNHNFLSQNLHFLHQSFINLQEKVWVFSYSQNISCF